MFAIALKFLEIPGSKITPFSASDVDVLDVIVTEQKQDLFDVGAGVDGLDIQRTSLGVLPVFALFRVTFPAEDCWEAGVGGNACIFIEIIGAGGFKDDRGSRHVFVQPTDSQIFVRICGADVGQSIEGKRKIGAVVEILPVTFGVDAHYRKNR